MVKRSFEALMTAEPGMDGARLAVVTEDEIRQQAREDGDDPNEVPDGYVLVPHPAALRHSLDLTEDAFAAFLRLPIEIVQNWERGRTLPDSAARTLPALVAADSERAIALLGRPGAANRGKPKRGA